MDQIDDSIQAAARTEFNNLRNLDRKQLRFNEIVKTAKMFYPQDPEGGARELADSCYRECVNSHDFIGPGTPNPLYVNKNPMWETLNKEYSWMIKEAKS